MILTCPLFGGIHYIKIIESFPVKIFFYCNQKRQILTYDYIKSYLNIKESSNYCQNRYLHWFRKAKGYCSKCKLYFCNDVLLSITLTILLTISLLILLNLTQVYVLNII